MSNDISRDIGSRQDSQSENIDPQNQQHQQQHQQHQQHHPQQLPHQPHQYPHDQDQQNQAARIQLQQYPKGAEPPQALPGPTGGPMNPQYNPLPVMVSAYPPGSALQQFQYQQAAYAQMQNPYYPQPNPSQINPPHQLAPSPLPNGHMPQMPPIPQDMAHVPSQQFHTPPRTMGAPSLPNLPKHGMTPVGSPEVPRKRQKRSDIITEDSELKAYAYRCVDLPLEEVAQQVRSIEFEAPSGDSTPNIPADSKTAQYKKDIEKERQRQIFGLVWLLKCCENKSGAVVPRNRVYARYVGVCADTGLKPLSPASFGKLVRAIFPNLSTRRLGMRGQSKYHYCGIKLIGENGNPSPAGSSASTPLHNPTFDSSFLPGTPYESQSPNSYQSQTSTPQLSHSTTATNLNSITSFINENISPDLKFVPDLIESLNNESTDLDQPLMLPQIKPFLPPSTDMDIADTLYGLYRAHCTSVFESLRYMQLKKLFNLLKTFHGSLTAPVLKLYTSPSLQTWIIASDSIMYKAIIKMLANLALQDIPVHVLQQLKQVAEKYTENSSTSLQPLPVKLAVAKLKLAKEFSQLISKLIRVAETAQSANKVLSHDFDRELMEKDWIKYVDVEQIAFKDLPCDGDNLKKAVEILKNKVPELLKNQEGSKDSILNIWASFISELPHQFKDVPPRLFLLCISALLTSALREISLAGGAGFGAWWVVRCWIDEWAGWCAELGGFISHQSYDLPVEQRDTSKPDNPPTESKVDETMPVDLLDGQFGPKKDTTNGNDKNGEESKTSKEDAVAV